MSLKYFTPYIMPEITGYIQYVGYITEHPVEINIYPIISFKAYFWKIGHYPILRRKKFTQ